jgi:hypothetical protein
MRLSLHTVHIRWRNSEVSRSEAQSADIAAYMREGGAKVWHILANDNGVHNEKALSRAKSNI